MYLRGTKLEVENPLKDQSFQQKSIRLVWIRIPGNRDEKKSEIRCFLFYTLRADFINNKIISLPG